MATNAEKYAHIIASVMVKSPEMMCLDFSRSIDYYGDFDCAVCALKGVCYSKDKLEAWLKQEASSNE